MRAALLLLAICATSAFASDDAIFLRVAQAIFRHRQTAKSAGLDVSVAGPSACSPQACDFDWRPSVPNDNLKDVFLFSNLSITTVKAGNGAVPFEALDSSSDVLPLPVTIGLHVYRLLPGNLTALESCRVLPEAPTEAIGLIWIYRMNKETTPKRSGPASPRRLHRRSAGIQPLELDTQEALELAKATPRPERPQGCRLKPVHVDFEILGWHRWIFAPNSYHVNGCEGSCNFQVPHERSKMSNHALLQSMIHVVDNEVLPEPCCVPIAYQPLGILLLNGDRLIHYRELPEMTAAACGCR